MPALLACARRHRRLRGWPALLAGGAEEALLHERQLLLALGEFQLQPLLGILAFESSILRDEDFQALVQPRILRLEQRGHLLGCFQVRHVLEAHHTCAVVLHDGRHRKLFLLEGRRRQLPASGQLAALQKQRQLGYLRSRSALPPVPRAWRSAP